MAREFDDFVGRLNSEDLGNLFRKSKIILDPSIIEGLGLTALEAAACGCVPIISKRNSYEDLFLPDLIPYVEIPNFLDPKLVIDTVMNIEKNNEYAKYSKNTLVYDWKSGLNNSSKAIKELLNPDKEL
jgi:glycosyltransferase involved in cell wall biosynthesis